MKLSSTSISLFFIALCGQTSVAFTVIDRRAAIAANTNLYSSIPSPLPDSTTTTDESNPGLILAPNRHATTHKRWGIDKDAKDEEYWFNAKIHTLGNTGFLGALHAAMAPMATFMIDELAYEGVDVRERIAKELAGTMKRSKARVVDLCCGVGMSTQALQKAFPEAERLVGVDTSPEMISMAKLIRDYQCGVQRFTEFVLEMLASIQQSLASTQAKADMGLKRVYVKAKQAIAEFNCANAENTNLPDKSFDLVTVMYAFHEAPRAGRDKILAEARRLLQIGGTLALVDISPEYEPSSSMLAGEPYVLEYQKNIMRQLQMVKGFTKATFRSIVPGHVGLWLLRRI